MLKGALTRWQFIRQILSGRDGVGVEAMSAREPKSSIDRTQPNGKNSISRRRWT
jgi:hypothetical protein